MINKRNFYKKILNIFPIRMRTGHDGSPAYLWRINVNLGSECSCGGIGDLTHIIGEWAMEVSWTLLLF